MPETVQHLLGQVVDGRFALRKLLGVSQNSAVFLTTAGEAGSDAAIKLIPEDPESSEAQLGRWRVAARLSHPGLLRILDCGRCVIDGSPCLYVVTELADEDLGQLLPQRALTTDEARGMLVPVLEALDFLHEGGMVHGGLKPSNIHAIADNVKLSADRISPAGESSTAWPLVAPFAAPESVLFPAADLWALGVTLCQTLAQSLPERDNDGKWIVPEPPAPFAKIVRSALVEDVTARISLDSVRALLDPAFVPKRRPETKPVGPVRAANVAALDPDSPEALIEAVQPTSATVGQASAAAASGASSRVATRAALPQIDPLSVPLSPVEPPSKTVAKVPAPARAPIPVSSLPQVNATVGSARRAVPSKPVVERSNKLALVAGAAALVLAILFVPRFLLRSSNAPARPAQNSAAPETKNAAVAPAVNSPSPATPAAPVNTKPAAPKTEKAASETAELATKPKAENPAAGAPTPAKIGAATAAPKSLSSSGNPLAPTVVRKILPEVSEKARSTISGTVRINVKVELNPDGTVSAAELNTPAPSQFFADLALKAARQWQFGPPASSDASAEPLTAAVIRFEFTQTSTAAYLP